VAVQVRTPDSVWTAGRSAHPRVIPPGAASVRARRTLLGRPVPCNAPAWAHPNEPTSKAEAIVLPVVVTRRRWEKLLLGRSTNLPRSVLGAPDSRMWRRRGLPSL